MKNITKDNKGITLIALVVTIVIMLILLTVTTGTGINTYKRAKVSKFVTQMQLLQTKIDDLVATKTTEELNNMSLQSVTTEEQTNAIINAFKQEEITTADTSKYKVFTKDDIFNILDIEDVENDILVNFSTREIIDVTGISYNGKIYYTQYKLPEGQAIINTTANTREVDFVTNLNINGINSTVTIENIKISNGTLSYKEQNDNYWQTVTNYTDSNKSYDISITKSGEYIIKLQDNTDAGNYVEKTITITLTNKPKTTLDLEPYNYGEENSSTWSFKQKDYINYVWIPRFAYKTDTETNTINIKFIKGNSNIATDNTYIDDSWDIHDKFTTSNGNELSGLWVRVDNMNQTGLNMIDLLNSDVSTLIEI